MAWKVEIISNHSTLYYSHVLVPPQETAPAGGKHRRSQNHWLLQVSDIQASPALSGQLS